MCQGHKKGSVVSTTAQSVKNLVIASTTSAPEPDAEIKRAADAIRNKVCRPESLLALAV